MLFDQIKKDMSFLLSLIVKYSASLSGWEQSLFEQWKGNAWMKFEPTHLRLPNENDAEIDVRIEIENEMEIA